MYFIYIINKYTLFILIILKIIYKTSAVKDSQV